MRFCLLLLISFVISCSQGGGGLKKSSGGTRTALTNSSSSANGTGIASVSMRYDSPAWPSEENALFYHVPGFADRNLKEHSRDIGSQTSPDDETAPTMPIRLSDQSNGSNFCFSNEEWKNKDTNRKNYPACVKAASNVVTHIKDIQETNSGLHSVFISALQFNFRNAPRSAGGDNYSEVVFENASIEKAKVSFNGTTGNPILSEQAVYNYGTGACNIDDQDAVGFDVSDQDTHRFILSGISSFERGKKKVFGEGTLDDLTYEATSCRDTSGRGFLCNLIADKVSVWHSLFVPVLYKNSRTNSLRISHRQYPTQVVSEGRLTGSKRSAVSHFGYYATTPPGNVFTTPIMGKVDRDGNEIPNWEQSFITKFCIKGKRIESLGTIPLIRAMHFELKSPRVKKIGN